VSIQAIPALVRGRHVRDDFQLPASEFAARRKKLCALLEEQELDGCLIYADSLCNGYLQYFSGYNAVITWSNAMLLVLRNGRTALLAAVPGRDQQRVETFVPPEIEVNLVGISLVANDHIGRAAADYADKRGLTGRQWGGINLGWCPFRAVDDLRAQFGEITDLTDIFNDIRLVKTPAELSVIGQAAALAKQGAIEAARACAEGQNEAAAMAGVNRRIYYAGAEDVQILIGTGARSGYLRPPEQRPFAPGEAVRILVEVQYLRYKAIYGLSACIDSLSEAQAKANERLAAAYCGFKQGWRAGAVIDALWRETQGLPDHSFSAAQSIGMDLAEPYDHSTPLKEGTVLSLILDHPDAGALLADTLLVTAGGLQAMSGPVHSMEL